MKHLALLICFVAASLRAENWPQWRGPFFNGSTTETGLPSTNERVAWVTPMPGYSGATPAVWGDNIFVSSPDEAKSLNLLCLDRRTGKIRWQKTLGDGDFAKGHNNMASPSPVTDGRHVWVMYGTGIVAALDMNGKLVWKRDLAKDYGKFSIMWLYGASPLLYQGGLHIPVLQRNPPTYNHALDDKPARESFLLCLDPLTGKDRWRQLRKTDAIEESTEAYTTPVPNGNEVLLIGADYLTAHNPATGVELWRCAGLNPKHSNVFRMVPSPLVADNTIIICRPRRNALIAFRNGKLAWELDSIMPDVCTPLFYRGKLFVLDGDRQTFAQVDHQTGAIRWQGKLEVTGDLFRASPTAADGKIYCISEKGNVFVLEAGDIFKVLATFKIAEPPCRSTIVAAQGQLFIRTGKNLYCLAKK
jgi:outer membrane protein assembly factor BamB